MKTMKQRMKKLKRMVMKTMKQTKENIVDIKQKEMVEIAYYCINNQTSFHSFANPACSFPILTPKGNVSGWARSKEGKYEWQTTRELKLQ
jgi:hypothetical protein